MSKTEEEQFDRKVLAAAIENSLPSVYEEDGYQSRSRAQSAPELAGSEHFEMASLAEELHQGGEAQLDQILAIVSHMLGTAAEKALDGYRGLDDTYIRLRSASDGTWLTARQRELRPDADQWIFDQKASDQLRNGTVPSVRGSESVRRRYLAGEINRLTSLGHAVNVALSVEKLRSNVDGLTPQELALAGFQIGFSSTSPLYKDDEARIVKQKKAVKDGRTKASSYEGRDEWLYAKFLELGSDEPKMKERHKTILEMTQRHESGYSWDPMKTVGAVENAIYKYKKTVR